MNEVIVQPRNSGNPFIFCLSGIQLWCTPVELVGIHWKLRFRSQEVLIERGYGWGPRSKATLKKVSIVCQLIFVYLILHQTWNLSQGKEELTFFQPLLNRSFPFYYALWYTVWFTFTTPLWGILSVIPFLSITMVICSVTHEPVSLILLPHPTMWYREIIPSRQETDQTM